jgi:hypothetical protein
MFQAWLTAWLLGVAAVVGMLAASWDALSAAFDQNTLSDLAFELSNPTINIHANDVLLVALRWKSYDTYLTEMKSLLN